MIRLIDIAWTAGFLEGDGHFRQDHGRLAVMANQVHQDPIMRLYNLYGGNFFYKPSTREKWNGQWVWWLGSRKAAEVMMTVYSLMSSKRQKQIRDSLSVWCSVRNRRYPSDEKCTKGHLLIGDNIRWSKCNGRRYRVCVTCSRQNNKERHAKERVDRLSKQRIRICEICGGDFLSSIEKKVTCSDVCSRTRANRSEYKAKYKKPLVVIDLLGIV